MLSVQVLGIQVLIHLGTTLGQEPGAGLELGLGLEFDKDEVVGEFPAGDEPAGETAEEIADETADEIAVETAVETATAGLVSVAETTVLWPVSVAVTGQIVVETAIVWVTTVLELAGQLVTVGAQLVMVTSVVVYTVEVVKL